MTDRASPRRQWYLVALAAVVACGPARTAAPPPHAATYEGEGLRVSLLWDAPVDLDLYVTTPTGETIYYANRGDAFVRDARCADARGATLLEEARWRSPAPGRYRVGVDFPEACGDRVTEAPYRIVVDAGGRRDDHTGTAHLLVRQPVAFEVVVP